LITTQSFVNNDNEEHIEDLEWYGYDPNVLQHNQHLEKVYQVHVENNVDDYINLTNYLNQQIDVMQESPSLGVDIYLKV